MTTETITLGVLTLTATHGRGPMLDVLVTSQLGGHIEKLPLTIAEWTSLRAVADVLAAADRRHAEDRAQVDVLKQEVRELEQQRAGARASIRALRHASATQMALSGGFVRCEHPECLASIDLPLIADSAWSVDHRGWWFCPAHEQAKERGDG